MAINEILSQYSHHWQRGLLAALLARKRTSATLTHPSSTLPGQASRRLFWPLSVFPVDCFCLDIGGRTELSSSAP
jgi:hypothetical protein